MFLRKVLVMIVPLAMVLVLCLVLPGLDGSAVFTPILTGLLLGIALALVLPLSGATHRKERFAVLLWVPALLLALVLVYQYLHLTGGANVRALAFLHTNSALVLQIEALFAGFMGTECLRTI